MISHYQARRVQEAATVAQEAFLVWMGNASQSTNTVIICNLGLDVIVAKHAYQSPARISWPRLQS